jgi:hypothetical protein
MTSTPDDEFKTASHKSIGVRGRPLWCALRILVGHRARSEDLKAEAGFALCRRPLRAQPGHSGTLVGFPKADKAPRRRVGWMGVESGRSDTQKKIPALLSEARRGSRCLVRSRSRRRRDPQSRERSN